MSAEYGADQIQILEGLRQSGNGLACILAALLRQVFITWYTRL